MSHDHNLDEELPCGGYPEEDKAIQKNMKILSEEMTELEINTNKKQTTQQVKPQQKECCQEACNGCNQDSNSCCNENACNSKKCETNTEKQEQKAQEQKLAHKKEVTVCKKCKTNPSALLHKNDPICRDCLLKNIEYKCRLTLENSMKVTGTSKILVCFSGGLNSICLVNILSSLKKRYQKHLLFGELRCLHIQQQSKIPENYKENFEKQTGIPLEILQIGQVFEGQNRSIEDVRAIFPMFNKSANSADLLALFRDKLIVDYARKNGFEFIVKGLNGESIATSIFKFFTKGIGGNVTQLSSIEKDSLYHYPLRQHLQKQLQYYFYTMRCSKLSLESQNDDLSNYCSTDLDDHLNDFILHLQTMYSHTAPAITRTCEKIESNRLNENRCQWCMLKGTVEPHPLCRKCHRIYECKNKLFDANKVPNWFKIAQ